MKRIILASGSPRRRELLSMLDIPFTVKVSETEEVITSSDPAKVVEELSLQKAEAVERELDKEAVIIGADTVVSIDGKILGKPANREVAREMILAIQGRSHMVYTGVTVICTSQDQRQCITFSEGTKVIVSPMGEHEIESYLNTKEPYDKAGGYGIQGIFAKYIEGIQGDYFNVVGLPVHRLYHVLSKRGLSH